MPISSVINSIGQIIAQNGKLQTERGEAVIIPLEKSYFDNNNMVEVNINIDANSDASGLFFKINNIAIKEKLLSDTSFALTGILNLIADNNFIYILPQREGFYEGFSIPVIKIPVNWNKNNNISFNMIGVSCSLIGYRVRSTKNIVETPKFINRINNPLSVTAGNMVIENNVTSLNVTAPSNVIKGDLLVAFIVSRSNTVSQNNFNNILSNSFTDASFVQTLSIWAKYYQSGSLTFNFTQEISNRFLGVIISINKKNGLASIIDSLSNNYTSDGLLYDNIPIPTKKSYNESILLNGSSNIYAGVIGETKYFFNYDFKTLTDKEIGDNRLCVGYKNGELINNNYFVNNIVSAKVTGQSTVIIK